MHPDTTTSFSQNKNHLSRRQDTETASKLMGKEDNDAELSLQTLGTLCVCVYLQYVCSQPCTLKNLVSI